MRHFLGQYPLNYTSIANERVLVGLKQYGERLFGDPQGQEQSFLQGNATAARKPHDFIAHVLYPYHEHFSEMIGRAGISAAVHDSEEKCGMDFFNELGYAKLASAEYVDGYGIYRVESHKAFCKLRTTTWVPQSDVDGFVRRMEAGTLKHTDVQMEIYPQLDLRNGLLYEKDGVLILRKRQYTDAASMKNEFPVMDMFMAVKCVGAEGCYCGDWRRTDKEIKFGQATSMPVVPAHRPNVTFKAVVPVKGKSWSRPIDLIVGLGKTEAQALANLAAIEADSTHMYDASYQWWKQWHEAGVQMKTDNALLDQSFKVSKTLMRLSFDARGVTTYMGYYWYQGAVWIRDNSWMIMGLANLGYADDAYRVLQGLRSFVKKRKDGSFHFLYGCRMNDIGDFSWESDSMGLILSAAGRWFDASGNLEHAKELWPWLQVAAEWICDNIDGEYDLMVPDAGIWEEWNEAYGRKAEHMTWTTLLSGYGIQKAGEIARALGHVDLAKKYEAVFKRLQQGLEKHCIKDGRLVRSPESTGRNLDTSVIYAWTWTPMLSPDHPALRKTLETIEERLTDPAVGGIWRHEYAGNDLGDTMPWPSSTMWVAEGWTLLNEPAKLGACLQWVLDHTSECAQIPECMFNRDVPHVTGMTSLSAIGLCNLMTRVAEAADKGMKLPPNIGSIKVTAAKKAEALAASAK